MVSTQPFSERPSTLPVSVAFRVQPFPVSTLANPFRVTSAPCAPVGAYQLDESGIAALTLAERRVAAIPGAGNGISVPSGPAAGGDPIATKQLSDTQHNSKKLYDATTVEAMTGVGGDPPRGRPN